MKRIVLAFVPCVILSACASPGWKQMKFEGATIEYKVEEQGDTYIAHALPGRFYKPTTYNRRIDAALNQAMTEHCGEKQVKVSHYVAASAHFTCE